MTLPTVRHTQGCDSGLIQFEESGTKHPPFLPSWQRRKPAYNLAGRRNYPFVG